MSTATGLLEHLEKYASQCDESVVWDDMVILTIGSDSIGIRQTLHGGPAVYHKDGFGAPICTGWDEVEREVKAWIRDCRAGKNRYHRRVVFESSSDHETQRSLSSSLPAPVAPQPVAPDEKVDRFAINKNAKRIYNKLQCQSWINQFDDVFLWEDMVVLSFAGDSIAIRWTTTAGFVLYDKDGAGIPKGPGDVEAVEHWLRGKQAYARGSAGNAQEDAAERT